MALLLRLISLAILNYDYNYACDCYYTLKGRRRGAIIVLKLYLQEI